MMPGDSQSKTAAIAADATVGQCQNCTVLHQSLTEYVSSFLALKQKITVSDDTIRLQQQLEELQIRLVTLEKKTADYESLQAELEQKKGALKAYEQLSEKMEQLKQENNKTVAENKNLEDQLKCVKEEQSLESAQLRREKAAMENDLLQTQESLKKCQAEADKTEILEKQNASLINMRDDLENKVQQFEESICKQNHQISQLTTEKKLIEININDLQVRLMKHERERCKEFKSAATQASVPTEPKLDKEKVRMLLQSLWACVDPKEEQSESQLHLPESSFRQILPSPPHPKHKSKQSQMSPSASQKISESNCYLIQTKATNVQLKPSPRSQNDAKSQASPRRLSEKKQAGGCKNKMQVPKQHKPDEQSPRRSRQEVSVDEILEMFRPMLPCISPLPDLDSERESVKMEEGQKEGHPERSEDFTVPKQDNLLNIPSVSLHKSPSFSTSQKEENGDLSEVTTQEYQNISKEDDFGQSGLCAVADVNNELIEDCEKDHSENDMLPEEEMASPSSSKSGGNVLPLATETREDSCGEILNSCADSISETKNVLEETKDYLDSVTEMDVDPSLTDVLDATAITANSGQQLRDNDVLLHPEEKQPVAVLASCESLKGTDVMENGSEVEKLHQDSCWSNLDTTVFKILESSECVSSEMPDHPSSSSDSMSCVSNINLKEKMESDGIHLCVDNNGNAALETGGTDCTTSPSELISDNTPVTLVLKEEDNKQHSDQERSELNSKTSPKKDVDTETKNVKVPVKSAPLFSDSPENVAVDCKSLEKSRHSACRRLSPTCILPSIKLEAVVMEQSTENRVSPTLSRDAEGIKQVAVKEFSQNSADPGCTVSLIKDTSLAKGQNECLETCEAMHGNQSSHGIVDGKGSSKGTPTSGQTPEFISHVLSEMGPPLPPVLTPLTTPPKAGKSINPRNAIEKLSFPSPMGGVASPTTPVEAQLCSSSLNSPTPPHGVLSSPLQFDSATPKHALPVPGRLPSKANNSSPSASASPPQGNSMKILDAMYPELSACARTLSILRGNVSLSMCSSESGTLPTSDGQVSSFKAISSTSTAFTKTESRREKRPAECLSQPKKSKCPKLGVSSADVTQKEMLSVTPSGEKDTPSPCTQRVDHFKTVSPEAEETDEHDIIVNSLEKIRNQCFDLLPVLQSHLYVGNLPKKPVLRDEEKDVISDICKPGSPQIEDMMLSILNKLKAEKSVLSTNYTQALCRVYTGICRQKSYWEKARILAYSILMEDFPDSAKLVLFMVSTWPNVLSNGSLLCQAIHTITKLKAQEGLLSCLSKFLGWEKNPPCDIDQLISRTVSELRLGSKQSFSKHSRYGEDLGNEAWEQIYTLQLLCSYKKWKWTYEHILGNELWPLMNSWVTQPRGQQEPVSDVNVATVLRLIGRLCQLGLKESCVTSVVTVANVINTFGRHGQTEGVPWEVQLAAIYCIYDLSPSNPKQALSALAEWRGETTQKVPPAVTSFINQIASICRQSKR